MHKNCEVNLQDDGRGGEGGGRGVRVEEVYDELTESTCERWEEFGPAASPLHICRLVCEECAGVAILGLER